MRKKPLPYPFPYYADIYEDKSGERFRVLKFNSNSVSRNDIFYTNKELSFTNPNRPGLLQEVFFKEISDTDYRANKFYFCASMPILLKNENGDIIERGSKLKSLKIGDMLVLNFADEIVDIRPYSELTKHYRFLTKNN